MPCARSPWWVGSCVSCFTRVQGPWALASFGRLEWVLAVLPHVVLLVLVARQRTLQRDAILSLPPRARCVRFEFGRCA
eukprot:1512085-Alexandrium_andersonii.AAC.1